MANLIQIMDETAVTRSLARITHEILEHDDGGNDICVIGIKSRGTEIAKILLNNIKKFAGIDIPYGEIDVTMFRDDISEEDKKLKATPSNIPFDVNNKTIILVDDVLYTGRTVRAAIEGIFSLGRPKNVQFAVLIDRGHRELPIRPDYVGKNVPSSKDERVTVKFVNTDGETGVYISR